MDDFNFNRAEAAFLQSHESDYEPDWQYRTAVDAEQVGELALKIIRLIDEKDYITARATAQEIETICNYDANFTEQEK